MSAWHVDIADGHGTAHEVTVDAQTGKVTTTHAARPRGQQGYGRRPPARLACHTAARPLPLP
ncbi:hypothetical protein [Streptomyces spiralis]|uniref:hypothetical protein n=1 Tax=Streptomyces spiralis TaxID=66376 RepID=UPI0036B5ED16